MIATRRRRTDALPDEDHPFVKGALLSFFFTVAVIAVLMGGATGIYG